MLPHTLKQHYTCQPSTHVVLASPGQLHPTLPSCTHMACFLSAPVARFRRAAATMAALASAIPASSSSAALILSAVRRPRMYEDTEASSSAEMYLCRVAVDGRSGASTRKGKVVVGQWLGASCG